MPDDNVKKTVKRNLKYLVGSQERPMPYSTSGTGIGVLKTGKTRPKTQD